MAGGGIKGQLQGTETKSQARRQGDGRVPGWATSHRKQGIRQVTTGQIQVQQGRRGCGKGIGEIQVSQVQKCSPNLL